MPLKTYTIQSEILATSSQYRLDSKYSIFTSVENWTIFPSSLPQEPLSKWIVELPIKKLKKGELDDEYFLVNISDQGQRSGTLEEVEEVTEVGSDKTVLNDCDIFVSKLGMPKGYIFLNTYKGKNIIGSTEFIPYVVQEGISPLLVKYILLHPNSLNAYASLESGKTPSHKRVNPSEFLKIKIPKIPLPLQNSIVAEIEPIEQRIAELKSQIIPASDIINRVFAREFRFDESLCHGLGKGMTASTQSLEERRLKTFETSFSDLARSTILRQSSRFHNPPTRKLMDFLDSKPMRNVYEVVESYEKGIQPNYDTEGDIPVIKIGNLKNGSIDLSDAEYTTQAEFDLLNDKKKVKNGDILLCATGKGSLGKIDIYEHDDPAITAVDNYIIRLGSNYNKLFFVYFFRSILGYFQIERDYTGATNQIHIYWEQISQFKIPDISLSEQQRIVDEIKAELDAQESIRDDIVTERAKIDMIIEKAMKI